MWTTLKIIKQLYNGWIWRPNRKKDTIWSTNWSRKLKQVKYLEDTKNNFIMDESDNQTETKIPFDPRHPVGGENWRSEILEIRKIMLHQPLHRNTNHYTVSLHKQKVLIERSCYLTKIRTKLYKILSWKHKNICVFLFFIFLFSSFVWMFYLQ